MEVFQACCISLSYLDHRLFHVEKITVIALCV